MTRQWWDLYWRAWWRRGVHDLRKTPNQAVPYAYEQMTERHGPRPETQPEETQK